MSLFEFPSVDLDRRVICADLSPKMADVIIEHARLGLLVRRICEKHFHRLNGRNGFEFDRNDEAYIGGLLFQGIQGAMADFLAKYPVDERQRNPKMPNQIVPITYDGALTAFTRLLEKCMAVMEGRLNIGELAPAVQTVYEADGTCLELGDNGYEPAQQPRKNNPNSETV